MFGNENKTECIDEILKFLESAVKERDAHYTTMHWCEDKTQDIMHELELLPNNYHERARLATELAEVRQRRRAAKDMYERLTPLVEWCDKQRAAVNALTRVLGEMRKIDEKQANRLYYKRADGNHEIIRRREQE